MATWQHTLNDGKILTEDPAFQPGILFLNSNCQCYSLEHCMTSHPDHLSKFLKDLLLHFIILMATDSIPLYSYTTLLSFSFFFSLLLLNLLPDLLLHLDTIISMSTPVGFLAP